MSKNFKVALAGLFVAAFAVATAAQASAPASSFPRNLALGATGSDVKELQMFLNACPDTALAVAAGATGSAGHESMTFGPATQNAVMAYQAKVGVSAVGAFGPMTRAQAASLGNVCGGVTPPPANPSEPLCPNGMTLASNCTTAPVTTPAEALCPNGMTLASNCTMAPAGGNNNPAPVVGLTGEGSVKEITLASAEESDFSEGQDKRELVAFDVELEDDGSLKLDRLDVYFEQTATASTKPWDYFDKAYVMVDGKEVASMDVDTSSDWSKTVNGGVNDILPTNADQEYRVRFSGMNAVLPSDETTKVTIAFDIASTISTDDEDAVWYFGTTTDSFRFTDATGFVFQEGDDLEDNFGADAADVAEIKVSKANSNPDASTIEVDESSDTNGVTIAVVKVEETEDVDVNITEAEVTLTTSDIDAVKKAYLYDGGTLIGSETVSGTTVTFDNLDWDLDGDDDQSITVKVDLDDTNSGARYAEGTTLSVSGFSITEATDEFDNDEGDINFTGSFTGETHELRTFGIKVEFVSATEDETFTADDALESDQGQFKVTFKVTAFGDDDLYVDRSCEAGGANAAGQGVEYNLSNAGSATATCVTSSSSSDADDTADVFQVEEGSTRTITLTVSATATATAFQEMSIESINWGTAAANTSANYYTFNLDDFKTDSLNLAQL